MGKTFDKHKKMLIVAMICIVVVLFIMLTARIWFIDMPEIKQIDLTFDAVKVDKDWNEVEAVQIHITGQHQDYRFQEDVIELNVDNFDNFTGIRMREKDSYVYFQDQGRGCIYFEAELTDRTYTDTLILYFLDGFDRVVLKGRGEHFYVGSGNGTYTPQECSSYFRENENEWKFTESISIDMVLDCVQMDQTGKEMGKTQLQISGYYRDYLFEDKNIYVTIDNLGEQVSSLVTPNDYKINIREMPERNLAFMWIALGGYVSSKQIEEVFYLFTTDEFDRFVISCESEGLFYAGSVSGKYTSREIVEYFNSFVKTGITLPEE